MSVRLTPRPYTEKLKQARWTVENGKNKFEFCSKITSVVTEQAPVTLELRRVGVKTFFIVIVLVIRTRNNRMCIHLNDTQVGLLL